MANAPNRNPVGYGTGAVIEKRSNPVETVAPALRPGLVNRNRLRFAGLDRVYWLPSIAPTKLIVPDSLNSTQVSMALDYNLVAVVEHDRGERFLRMKITFTQPTETAKLQALVVQGISGQFEVATSDAPADSEQDGRIFREEGKE